MISRIELLVPFTGQVEMFSGPDAILIFMVDRSFCTHSWEQVIQGVDDDGVPGLKTKFWVQKKNNRNIC